MSEDSRVEVSQSREMHFRDALARGDIKVKPVSKSGVQVGAWVGAVPDVPSSFPANFARSFHCPRRFQVRQRYQCLESNSLETFPDMKARSTQDRFARGADTMESH